MKKGTFALIAVAGLATAVAAQPADPTNGRFTFDVSNVVSPGTPMATVSVYAVWDDPAAAWVFAVGTADLTAGDGQWQNGVNAHPGFGSTLGTIGTNVVSGFTLGQFHLPAVGQIGSQDNPFLLATYEWTTTNFTARNVPIETTSVINFRLAEWGPPPLGGAAFQMFPQAFSPGIGVIQVIPAPSALALLGLGGLVAIRRRR